VEGHGGDLVHVVVAVGGEAAEEGDFFAAATGGELGEGGGGVGEVAVLFIEGGGVGGGDGVVGFFAGAEVVGVFADDGGVFDLLSGGVFDFDDAGEVVVVGVVDLHGGLEEAVGDGEAGGFLI
jgi:hypothetical protein